MSALVSVAVSVCSRQWRSISADVPILVDVDDDVRVGRRGVLEKVLDLPEVLLDVARGGGRHVDVSPRVLEIHT